MEDPRLNWEYILIDEVQDWSAYERDIILSLYDRTHVIVADGGRQFVRNIEACDWTIVSQKKSIKLKSCLRQKNNLIKFVNNYARLIDGSSNNIISSEKMHGGKIIILRDTTKTIDVLKSELKEIKKTGNSAYDMLILTPSSLVEHDGDEKSFSLKKDFEFRNILIWDGTNDDNRTEYAIDPDAARVFQYESARGLEGWTVCCMNFDEYLEMKEEQFDPKKNENKLLLESVEERKSKYLLNWALIPLTRAIDTLIITLKDEHSKYAQDMINLAGEYGDYIKII